MSGQQRYFEEYEKYKSIEVRLGTFPLRKESRFTYTVLSINGETVELVSGSGNKLTKTLHWCRKNLDFNNPVT